jgi:hypothetical protein
VDMEGAFGASWRTSGDILWGFAGTTQNTTVGIDGPRLLYVSEPTGSAAPTAASSQSGPANSIIAFKNYFIESPAPNDMFDGTVANSGIGNPTDDPSWTSRASLGFNSTNLLPLEAPLGTGMDLYRLPQTNDQSLVTNEGLFTINLVTDTITFTPVVVPEPGTLALLGGAAISLGFSRRRRGSISL